MSKSTFDLRLLLGLALFTCALGACSVPDVDPAAATTFAATAATDGSAPMSAATEPEIGETEDAPAAAPSGPVDQMAKQLVAMAAGLHATERACLPDRAASVSDTRAANRKVMAGMTATTMSEAEMDALFDAEYSKAQQKMEAMSGAELSKGCAELEAAAKAGAAAVSR